MPDDLKDWFVDHMNCEVVAMNFPVANKRNILPIKVAIRKKLKCLECNYP